MTSNRASVRPQKLARGQRNDHARLAFASWLVLTPSQRQPRTQDELARQLGVASSTLSEWRRLPLIQAVTSSWKQAYAAHFNELMDALWRRARSGNVQAIKLAAEILGELAPTKVEQSIEEVSVTYTKPEALREYAVGVLRAKEQEARRDN